MAFPIRKVNQVAKKESWRKEIYRPIYHIHKWWAQRLGSIFRAILIHVLNGSDEEWDLYYKKNELDKVVLDPFMGSGTTLGEALKLGARVIGCDINPVSTFMVQQELTHCSQSDIVDAYREVESKVADEIKSLHTTLDPATGNRIPVLYYFWVKIVYTPNGEIVPLFANYVISQDAYPSKKPGIQILCPRCWNVFPGLFTDKTAECSECGTVFDPWSGPASGQYVCGSDGTRYKIKSLIPSDMPPEEKMFALLAQNCKGEKVYLPITDYDLDLYDKATSMLAESSLPLPVLQIAPGHNTDQARGYGYTSWRDFFNSRQLYSLGILLKAILEISNISVRKQFMCLFNSTLEFNNRFCSYKGEGTGAVRPIFYNHILKPERKPIENSVWGNSASSGTFFTLFKSRLLTAKDYLNNPFELFLDENGKSSKVVASKPIIPAMADSFEELSTTTQSALILNGDSADLPLPDSCVDAVVTDPPYFDFVHYSELSDFFYAWLQIAFQNDPLFSREYSKHCSEVQDKEEGAFAIKLASVFVECYRVLKDGGALCFSFHHSRNSGWDAIAYALAESGFYVKEVIPVYAELMAATPKSASKEPISIDALLVCTKSKPQKVLPAWHVEGEVLSELNDIALSKGDRFVISSACKLQEDVNSRTARLCNIVPNVPRPQPSDLLFDVAG